MGGSVVNFPSRVEDALTTAIEGLPFRLRGAEVDGDEMAIRALTVASDRLTRLRYQLREGHVTPLHAARLLTLYRALYRVLDELDQERDQARADQLGRRHYWIVRRLARYRDAAPAA